MYRKSRLAVVTSRDEDDVPNGPPGLIGEARVDETLAGLVAPAVPPRAKQKTATIGMRKTELRIFAPLAAIQRTRNPED